MRLGLRSSLLIVPTTTVVLCLTLVCARSIGSTRMNDLVPALTNLKTFSGFALPTTTIDSKVFGSLLFPLSLLVAGRWTYYLHSFSANQSVSPLSLLISGPRPIPTTYLPIASCLSPIVPWEPEGQQVSTVSCISPTMYYSTVCRV